MVCVGELRLRREGITESRGIPTRNHTESRRGIQHDKPRNARNRRISRENPISKCLRSSLGRTHPRAVCAYPGRSVSRSGRPTSPAAGGVHEHHTPHHAANAGVHEHTKKTIRIFTHRPRRHQRGVGACYSGFMRLLCWLFPAAILLLSCCYLKNAKFRTTN